MSTENVVNAAFTTALTTLIAEGQEWERAYARTHEQLYAVLGKCLGFARHIVANENKAALMFEGYLKGQVQQGLIKPFPDSATVYTKVVRVVFGPTDRQRISNYVMVLKTADALDIKVENMANWIKEKGGVESIRLRNMKRPKMGKEVFTEHVRRKVHALPAITTLDKFRPKSDGNQGAVILLGRVEGNGTVSILGQSTDAALIGLLIEKLKLEPEKQAA
jgi:hypothetical protein